MQKKNAFLHALITQLSKTTLIASYVIPHQVTARTMGFTNHPFWIWVGTLSAGPVWQGSGNTQTVYLAPGIEKSYIANNAHGFQSTPTLIDALPTPGFSSHTQTAFTDTVGTGIQKALHQHWQVGVGYEFADWGKSSLGHAEGQALNNELGLNRF